MKKTKTSLSLNKKMIAKLSEVYSIKGGQVGTIGSDVPNPEAGDTNTINPVMSSTCPTVGGGSDFGVESKCLCAVPADLF